MRAWVGFLFLGCAVAAASCDDPGNECGASAVVGGNGGGGATSTAGHAGHLTGGTASGGTANGGAGDSAGGEAGAGSRVPACAVESPSACGARADCRVLSAFPAFAGPPQCREATAQGVGCVGANTGCTGAETTAQDPEGNEWLFLDGCLPAGWTAISGAIDEICAGGAGNSGGAGGAPP